MGFQDWVDIVEGKDVEALNKMIKYCKKDVVLLEKIFNKAKAFFKPKSNAGLILRTGRHACPRCGSQHTQKYGTRVLVARIIQRVHCAACGSIFDGATAI
jgi:ribosomal protein S27AE